MAILRIRDENGKVIEIPSLQGLSAYEIAVKNGFVGTEEEWLESLKATAEMENFATKEYVNEIILGGAW